MILSLASLLPVNASAQISEITNASTNLDGSVVTLTFNASIIFNSLTPVSSFTLFSTGANITNINNPSSTQLELILDPPILEFDNMITLSYTSGVNQITDLNNISIASFTNQNVINNIPPSALGTDWSSRQRITIDSNQVTGNHTNFTVLINIQNDPNLNSTNVQSAGQDIRFTTNDGFVLLEHEIEYFSNNATFGTIVAWVKLPTLTDDSDTILYMYYNNSNATLGLTLDAWDSDYEIIYHMNQSTFTANSTLDSSGNDCHATPLFAGSTAFNSNDLVSAQIGNGLNFDGVANNNGDYLDLPDLASSLFYNTDFTISAWTNIDALKSWARIVDFGNGPADNNILFAIIPSSQDLRYDVRQGSSFDGITASNVLQTSQWAYFTAGT
ncbi:MAG: DUF2341 domain-containing protein [Candidatus Nitrosoabyssus spongiisocia]|nr:MAG: DUF2341 domain-containing protein [Nitrosopumilaceae archaeon AB1(1)]